jgi:hypothetical protein
MILIKVIHAVWTHNCWSPGCLKDLTFAFFTTSLYSGGSFQIKGR